MKPLNLIFGCCLVAACMLSACGGAEEEQHTAPVTVTTNKKAAPAKLFESLTTQQTGIDFRNTIQEDAGLNFYRYQYLYNGGGVGIGDLNGDDLPDIYFTGNMVADRLYMNRGNMKFEEVTAKAGIRPAAGWKTGVSFADVNADGLLDIYVCRSGWYEKPEERTNLLYINQGNEQFQEMAAAYGLDDSGHSVLGGFFDYDRDGDLDMYLTSHPVVFKQKLSKRLQAMANPEDAVRDKLYRNEGNGKFTEVSRTAGIVNYGHGLGLTLADLDKDGWTDIYVANDFQSPDYFYHNNGNGTFTENLDGAFRHVSYFSMGCDAGDINNDGELDLFVVEMLAEDNKRQKTNMAPMNPKIFETLVSQGFKHQLMRNVLQLNNGNGSFSEIAYYAGLSTTDWSWGPLFGDYDHDGDQDLIVTNGYLRDTQDKDFVKESNKLAATQGNRLDFSQVQSLLPSTRLQNYAFQNEGDFKFRKVSAEWGFNFAGYSNGVAYGDLDGDGDLDLVVNNINDPASIYRNMASEQNRGHFLNVRFKGPKGNPNGLGAKVRIEVDGQTMFREFSHVHGFQSSCDYQLHFGLGAASKVDRLTVTWPDGKEAVQSDIAADQTLTLTYAPAQVASAEAAGSTLLTDVSASMGNSLFAHRENAYDDYARELLLPHKQSQNGPRIVTGDINGDGRDDFYIGGAAGQAGGLYLQTGSGGFAASAQAALAADAGSEDLGGVMFDADGDGDQDLYVVSGGNEFNQGDARLQDRLYLNDNGKFRKASSALPVMKVSGGCAVAGDYDGDGDLDLFVGGRLIPGMYPYPPRSYVLRNDGGKFSDVTQEVAEELLSPGLVTTAAWTDIDGDGKQDLIVAGEWMPIMVLKNDGSTLKNAGTELGLGDSQGWWNKVLPVDIDGDGDMDIIAGNLGENYKYRASKEEPFHVYCHDFDNNGTQDIVLGYYNSGTCFPVRGRQCSSEQMPMIKDKFPTYAAFGEASLKDVYGDALEQALHAEARTFQSVLLRNEGDRFTIEGLPAQAQFAPVQGIVAHDFDGDQQKDVLVAGNWYVAEVETGRADAGIGLLLKGQAQGFVIESAARSGFFAWDDVRDLALLQTGAAPIVLVANNDGPMQVFRVNGMPIN